MSMLADPKQKKRYNLVPRGKALYEDDSRYGTKMLEKMGWSKGNGLGPKEDGAKDFVRVRYKNDAEGLGYESHDDQWTQHQEGFNGLLNALNGADDANTANPEAEASGEELGAVGLGFLPKPKSKKKKENLKEKLSGHSLEEKSKNSKVRVHYKKFTRGKDLSRCSEKDLANIFGKKEMKEEVEIQPATDTQEKDVPPNFGGVQTYSAGLSVSDYFKQKMESLKKKIRKTIGSPGKHAKVSAEVPNEVEVTEPSSTEIPDKKAKKKDKKSKNKDKVDITDLDLSSGSSPKNLTKSQKAEENTTDVTVERQVPSGEKKKKKKKLSQETEQDSGEAVQSFEDTQEAVPKKKSKSKFIPREVIDVPVSSDQLSLHVPVNAEINYEAQGAKPKVKKVKSKKLQKEEVQNTTASTNGTTIEEVTMIVNEEKRGKKKKRSKTAEEERDIILANAVEQPAKALTPPSCLTPCNTIPETNYEMQEARPKIKKPKRKGLPKNKESAQSKPENNGTSLENGDAIPRQKHLSSAELKEVEEKLKACNEYKISRFAAEKFANFDFGQFAGSNLETINGYGLDGDLSLKVVDVDSDADRIMALWTSTLDKYKYAEPKYEYRKFVQRARLAYKTKKPVPKFNVKSLQRKDVFAHKFV